MGHYEKGWQEAKARIAAAARAAGRSPETIRLLAVSKTFTPEAIRRVHALGQRAFGESYVQEAVEKRANLADLPDIEWHLVGPLQSNKARAAAQSFDWVESIDRMKIAERLSEARPRDMPSLNVLIQVNVSGETTKSGVRAAEAAGLAAAVGRLPRLTLRGIMGIPEPTRDTDVQRSRFRVLRQCFEACRAAEPTVDTLSMGMSSDLEAAIAEGATQVRVGTLIFGPRA